MKYHSRPEGATTGETRSSVLEKGEPASYSPSALNTFCVP
jgi:hypothetical protein